MTFFAGFPEVIYKYGNEKEFNLAQNLSVYVDIIDRFKDQASAVKDLFFLFSKW